MQENNRQEITLVHSKAGLESEVFLFQLPSNAVVESVYFRIRDGLRDAVCLSVSAGCVLSVNSQACVMCATGNNLPFEGNLSAGQMAQIVFQIIDDRRQSPDSSIRVNFAGEGEPLLNLKEVMRAIKLIQQRFGVTNTHFLLSTVGAVPQIHRLSQYIAEDSTLKNVALRISLHGMNDKLRNRIIPFAERYSLSDVGAACYDFLQAFESKHPVGNGDLNADTLPQIRLNFLPLELDGIRNFDTNRLAEDFNSLATYFPVEQCVFVIAEWNAVDTTYAVNAIKNPDELEPLILAAEQAGFKVRQFRSLGSIDQLGACGTLAPHKSADA